MKKIAILLPGIPSSPIGGYKVVYEYANMLAQDGYTVDIYYPSYVFTYTSWHIKILKLLKAILRFIYCNIVKSSYHTQWFALDKRVREYFVWSLSENYISGYDIYVATAVKTAICLNKFKNSKKCYLIQHYEEWGDISENILLETYKKKNKQC